MMCSVKGGALCDVLCKRVVLCMICSVRGRVLYEVLFKGWCSLWCAP